MTLKRVITLKIQHCLSENSFRNARYLMANDSAAAGKHFSGGRVLQKVNVEAFSLSKAKSKVTAPYTAQKCEVHDERFSSRWARVPCELGESRECQTPLERRARRVLTSLTGCCRGCRLECSCCCGCCCLHRCWSSLFPSKFNALLN